ncbi:C6 zinc finger domain protein [Penicillium longicatenatum]|uniref:C6 zinc finger domain protein n=1 Tax=Penicillium longicatenatum TaxID=1561947 RepID=UPI0025498CED|nr:C6 zinc finger domain protein [Penicillium longicatenatum]KAJ5639907.1 C6 zinc finger domain protein [Penicillium longicatenatum]
MPQTTPDCIAIEKNPCAQCTRANKECGGYQDPNSLRIYDQSKEVAVKAQSRSVVRSKTSTPETSMLLPLIHEPISIDEKATSHTFTYYVGKDESRGLLSFLSGLLSTDPSLTLQATIKAIGLASLSRIHKLPDLRQLAGLEYSKALRSLNKALQNPVTAKTDSTLGTVTLFSLYEMVASHDMTSGHFDIMDGWWNHVQGATRLLELRGVEQLDSDVGLELFTTIRLQNVISSVLFRRPVQPSPTIAAISEVAKARRDENSQPIEDLYNILLQFNDLAAEVNDASRGKYTVENLGRYIGKALRVDADLRSWAMSVGPGWCFTTIKAPVSHDGHIPFYMRGDTYHFYFNVYLASMWNHYRQTRLVLHEMVRVMAVHLYKLRKTSECEQTIIQSVAIINQVVDDICASVRYHFISDQACFGGALRLLWPLFVSANISHIDSATREWIAQVLAIIGESMGIYLATTMAQLIRKGELFDMVPGT